MGLPLKEHRRHVHSPCCEHGAQHPVSAQSRREENVLREHGRALVWGSWRPGRLGTRLLKGNVWSPFTAWASLSASPSLRSPQGVDGAPRGPGSCFPWKHSIWPEAQPRQCLNCPPLTPDDPSNPQTSLIPCTAWYPQELHEWSGWLLDEEAGLLR